MNQSLKYGPVCFFWVPVSLFQTVSLDESWHLGSRSNKSLQSMGFWAWKRWSGWRDIVHLLKLFIFSKFSHILQNWGKKPKLILKLRFSCQALLKEMHLKIPQKARKLYLKPEGITEKIGGEIVFYHLLRHNLVWNDGFLPGQVLPLK